MFSREFLKTQNFLSKTQAVPILGPVFVSPVKITLSQIQMISHTVEGVFYAIGAFFTYMFLADKTDAHINWLKAVRALNIAYWGFFSHFYAKINISTFGLFGLFAEWNGFFNSLRLGDYNSLNQADDSIWDLTQRHLGLNNDRTRHAS